MMQEVQTGKIKFYNADKGYGFIKGDAGKDYFYHISDMASEDYTPAADDRVRFNVVTGKKGLKASFVQPC